MQYAQLRYCASVAEAAPGAAGGGEHDEGVSDLEVVLIASNRKKRNKIRPKKAEEPSLNCTYKGGFATAG